MAEIQNSGANSGGGSSYMSDLLGGGDSSSSSSSSASATATVEQDTEQIEELNSNVDDSEGMEQEGKQEQQGEDSWLSNRINELARSKGVDPNDPKVRELLKDVATLEKRKSDADGHIKRLEQQTTDEWITDFERQLQQQKPQQQETRQEQPQNQQQNQQQTTAQDRFNDIGTRNGWRIPEDAYRDELEAYGDGNSSPDLRRLHEVRSAQFMRMADAYLMPAVMDILEKRFGAFEKEKLADIVPVVQQTQQEQLANRSRARAYAEIEKAGGETFREIMKPDQEGFVEVDGVRLPNSPFNRIMKEFPEYLDRVNTAASETEQIQQYINVYRFAMKMHARSKQSGLTPQKAKQIMQAGIEQKKRQDTQHRARAAMNAGGSRGPGATSKGGYVSEMAEATHGQTLADLMRR